jgi:branched-chain amino acid transport system permease protein
MNRAPIRRATILAGAALVGVVWLLLPLLISRSTIDLLVFTALYSIAGLGVGFLLGQCGIVSLAQSLFYGIGAYATAYGCTVLHLPWPFAMLLGILLSIGIAAAVGAPVLRLSGYFLALATLALAIIGHVLFLEWDWLTGGTLGIGGIPRLSLFGYALNTPQKFYYAVWPLTAVVMWLHYNLLTSRSGYAMRAMRDAPAAAAVLGIEVQHLKIKIFVLSAALGAFAGSLFAHYVSFVSVDSFGVDRAITFLVVAIVGGAGTVIGIVLGAAFAVIMPNMLSSFGDLHPLLFAISLIVTVIVLPEGFGGAVLRLKKWLSLHPLSKRQA